MSKLMMGGLAGVAALLLTGQALAGASEPVTLIDPAHPTDSLISVSEDSPEWNCLTMGNRECGPDWTPADPEWSAEPDGTRHDGCLVSIGETTYLVCPDGYTAVS